MTINYTTAPGFSGVHYSTHVTECAKQAAYIDMPVAAGLGFMASSGTLAAALVLVVTGAPIFGAVVAVTAIGTIASAAALSGTGFVASCSLGRIADEYSHDSDHNTAAVVAARALGGIIKYTITGPTTLARAAAGAVNNALYGLASKTLESGGVAEVASPVAIEMIDSVMGGDYLLAKPGIAAGLGVSFFGYRYTPTDRAQALNLAIKKGQCHIDCEIAKGISYNNITECPVVVGAIYGDDGEDL